MCTCGIAKKTTKKNKMLMSCTTHTITNNTVQNHVTCDICTSRTWVWTAQPQRHIGFHCETSVWRGPTRDKPPTWCPHLKSCFSCAINRQPHCFHPNHFSSTVDRPIVLVHTRRAKKMCPGPADPCFALTMCPGPEHNRHMHTTRRRQQ